MCMLTFIPGGVQPDAEALRNGAEFNKDGHGFAIVYGKRMVVRHSMDSEYAISEFVRLRAKHPHGPAMFHSRFGTGGMVGEYNCHPFRIGGDRRTVLGHNGVLPLNVQPGKGDTRCDTRITAQVTLRDVNLGDAKIRSTIGEWMGKANKFVILTTNPRYSQQHYIINEAAGVWSDDGQIWYSNRDFEGYGRWDRYTTTTIGGKRSRWAWEQESDGSESCWSCNSTYLEPTTNVCQDCNMCQDCGEDVEAACQCMFTYPALAPLPKLEPLDLDYEPEPVPASGLIQDYEPDGAWSLD